MLNKSEESRSFTISLTESKVSHDCNPQP